MKTTHVVVLDFKVFDKVPHALLLQKLKILPEIHSRLVNWTQNLLIHRKQKVGIEGNFFQS